MGKSSLAGASLIAAIPGAFLTYLMVMTSLNSFDHIPMILQVVVIATLIFAAMMALFPAYVFIWYGGRGPKKERAPKASAAAAAPVAAAAGTAAASEFAADLDDFESVDEEGSLSEAEFEEEEYGDEEYADDDSGYISDEFEAAGDLDDEFEFEDFEDDDEFA